MRMRSVLHDGLVRVGPEAQVVFSVHRLGRRLPATPNSSSAGILPRWLSAGQAKTPLSRPAATRALASASPTRQRPPPGAPARPPCCRPPSLQALKTATAPPAAPASPPPACRCAPPAGPAAALSAWSPAADAARARKAGRARLPSAFSRAARLTLAPMHQDCLRRPMFVAAGIHNRGHRRTCCLPSSDERSPPRFLPLLFVLRCKYRKCQLTALPGAQSCQSSESHLSSLLLQAFTRPAADLPEDGARRRRRAGGCALGVGSKRRVDDRRHRLHGGGRPPALERVRPAGAQRRAACRQPRVLLQRARVRPPCRVLRRRTNSSSRQAQTCVAIMPLHVQRNAMPGVRHPCESTRGTSCGSIRSLKIDWTLCPN